MITKLSRSTLPSNHTKEDFECFGPVATKNTEFLDCKLADMGCFKQEEVDSNKYYHCAVVKSKKNGQWYLYIEFGKTRNRISSNPQFQFVSCDSEQEACKEFVKQCNEKNTKRGVWEKIGTKERFIPKSKKDGSVEDLYVIRYLVSRNVGLPGAKNICNLKTVTKTVTTHHNKIDPKTLNLFRDLIGGTINYTKSVMVGGTVPSQDSIDEARDLLQDALKQVKKIGNNLDDQVNDSDLKKLTYNLYGMIPKEKPKWFTEANWILSQENIGQWQNDLDAFESAIKSVCVEECYDDNIMSGIAADVEWLDPESELGKFVINWWRNNTKNRHGCKSLVIHNVWKINRHGDDNVFNQNIDETLKEIPEKWNNERPILIEKQKERLDRTAIERKKYWEANVSLLFHGSRSCNIASIIREGFRFPKELVGVMTNGSYFGCGTYYADDWGKSTNYCSVSNGNSLYAGSSGHIPKRKSFMFAVDVILGNPFLAKTGHGYTKPPEPHHSVLGKAGFTDSWGHSSGLQNNEWIVYRKHRANIRYLAECSWY